MQRTAGRGRARGCRSSLRKGGDSNSRDGGCPPAGFQDRCIQPLCHPSPVRAMKASRPPANGQQGTRSLREHPASGQRRRLLDSLFSGQLEHSCLHKGLRLVERCGQVRRTLRLRRLARCDRTARDDSLAGSGSARLVLRRSSGAEARIRAGGLFGVGPRFCPGRNLAFLEAKSTLAMVARDFHIEPDDSAGTVGERFNFAMIPDRLRVRLRLRERVSHTSVHAAETAR